VIESGVDGDGVQITEMSTMDAFHGSRPLCELDVTDISFWNSSEYNKSLNNRKSYLQEPTTNFRGKYFMYVIKELSGRGDGDNN
jgi:hypothetical protein